MAFLDNDGVTRLTGDYLDIFARKEDAVLDPSGGLIRTDDGISIDSLVRESNGEVSGAIAELTAKGHAEQFTTTGKNLLPNNATSQTIDGVTFTVNADGSVTANGTATALINYYLCRSITFPAGTYTISGAPSITNNSAYNVRCEDHAEPKSQRMRNDGSTASSNVPTGTIPANVPQDLLIRIYSGVTVSNVTFYPQLEAGSTATEYEPYTGGAPSPSPDYPQEIQVVRGRNLLDVNTPYIVGKYWSASYEQLSAATLNIYKVSGVAGKTLTLSCIYTASSSAMLGIVSFDTNNVKTNVTTYSMLPNTSLVKTFVVPSDSEHIEIPVYNNGYMQNTQLTLGSTPQPYVPYGHVGMEVHGENLVDLDASKWVVGGRDSSYGNINASATWRITQRIDTSGTPVEPGKQYMFECDDLYQGAFYFYRNDNSFVTALSSHWYSNGSVITIPNNATKMAIVIRKTDDSTMNTSQAAEAEVQFSFHTTTPIPLPQRGWVAGLSDGTADTLMLDGAGKVEWEKNTDEIVLDGSSDENWLGWGTNGCYTTAVSDLIRRPSQSSQAVPMFASRFIIMSRSDIGTTSGTAVVGGMAVAVDGNIIIVIDDETATIERYRSWLSTHNVTVLYPLATPVTEDCGYVDMPAIPVDATVTIPELDALGIKYFVDDSVTGYGREIIARGQYDLSETNGEIDTLEASIAPVESVVATSNHAVGDYFMLGNVLMKTTTAIASGEKITTSNATPATVQSQINALRDSVGNRLSVKSFYLSDNRTFSFTVNNLFNMRAPIFIVAGAQTTVPSLKFAIFGISESDFVASDGVTRSGNVITVDVGRYTPWALSMVMYDSVYVAIS